MVVKCVLAQDAVRSELLEHSEHTFVSVPRSGDSVSVMIDGALEVFFVTGVMHCEMGIFGPGSAPIVNVTIAKEPRGRGP